MAGRLGTPWLHPVSILTHLVGWVQRSGWPIQQPGPPPMEFQSSPTWSGGCNGPVDVSNADLIGFQSSPTWSGGCNPSSSVSILSIGCGYDPDEAVSILTHLVGWVQLERSRSWVHGVAHHSGGFNPHPPGRVGATGDHDRPTHLVATPQALLVSILTHLVGWVQTVATFQSSGMVGWVQPRKLHAAIAFQSSPTWSGGCNGDSCSCRRAGATEALRKRFQSSPTWSGGCNILSPRVDQMHILNEGRLSPRVSILTHLVGWVQQGWEVCVRLLSPVFGY